MDFPWREQVLPSDTDQDESESREIIYSFTFLLRVLVVPYYTDRDESESEGMTKL